MTKVGSEAIQALVVVLHPQRACRWVRAVFRASGEASSNHSDSSHQELEDVEEARAKT